jgi:hypothetical protein
MKALLLVFAKTIVALVLKDTQDAELRYVFEVNRHGARSPIHNAYGFPADDGMLTPQGMRQRYLLGKYNKLRYMEFKHNYI